MVYGNSKSAAVAILKGSFQGKILKNVVHDSGRWIILVVEFMEDIFILGNMYGYIDSPRNMILSFVEFEGQTNAFIKTKLTFGGEGNCVSDCHPQRSLRGTYGKFSKLGLCT